MYIKKINAYGWVGVVPEVLLPVFTRLIQFHLTEGLGRPGARLSIARIASETCTTKGTASKHVSRVMGIVSDYYGRSKTPKYREFALEINPGAILLEVLGEVPRSREYFWAALGQSIGLEEIGASFYKRDRHELDSFGDPVCGYTETDRMIDEEEQRIKNIEEYFNYGGEGQ